MDDKKVARRDVLRGTITLALVAAGGTAIAACSKKGGGELSCSDTTGLKPDEVANRTALAYTDKSPYPDKQCTGCAQFVAPSIPGTCGTCKVLKGNVHPNGYCKSWVAKNAAGAASST